MIFKGLVADIDCIMRRDPAARSRIEVLFCYPGLHAVLWHRLAHALWRRGLCFLGRLMSHIGRMLTGIEIHPGAQLSRGLMIDHGVGVVIGETAEIGRNVTLYQGVTLGGTSLNQGKRHPTLEEGVIVGAGAQVLGPITVGAGARVGANAVVLQDVPPGVTVVGIPARIAMAKPADEEFTAYGTPGGDLPDPVIRAIDTLRSQLATLEARLHAVEGKDGETRSARRGTDS